MAGGRVRGVVRIAAVLLSVCVLCGALSSCGSFELIRDRLSQGDPDDAAFTVVAAPSISGSPAYAPVVTRYAYAMLGARQQQLYDALLEQVGCIENERNDLGKYPMKAVRIPGELNIASIRVVLRAMTNDHPELFWLSQTFAQRFFADENVTKVVAYSEFPPDEVSRMAGEIDAVCEAFFASIPAGLDAYQREKAVHDYLLDRCEYDHEVAASGDVTARSLNSHSIYGALVQCRCVCEGYGMAMQLLLNALGVGCVTLTGRSGQEGREEELHLWNAVLLDSGWYHVDATWDDQEEPMHRYDYFNLDDQTLMEDHSLSLTPDELGDDRIEENGTEDMNLFIPACVTMSDNYYVRECPHLTDYGGGEVIGALFRAALTMESTFTFYIDPAYLDYGEAIRLLFRENPQYFFSYAERVNGWLTDYEIDNSNLTYYQGRKLGKVTVELRYY